MLPKPNLASQIAVKAFSVLISSSFCFKWQRVHILKIKKIKIYKYHNYYHFYNVSFVILLSWKFHWLLVAKISLLHILDRVLSFYLILKMFIIFFLVSKDIFISLYKYNVPPFCYLSNYYFIQNNDLKTVAKLLECYHGTLV